MSNLLFIIVNCFRIFSVSPPNCSQSKLTLYKFQLDRITRTPIPPGHIMFPYCNSTFLHFQHWIIVRYIKPSKSTQTMSYSSSQEITNCLDNVFDIWVQFLRGRQPFSDIHTNLDKKYLWYITFVYSNFKF